MTACLRAFEGPDLRALVVNVALALALVLAVNAGLFVFVANEQTSTHGGPFVMAIPGWFVGLVWTLLFVALAIAKWRMQKPSQTAGARGIVVLLIVCAVYPLYTGGLGSASIGLIGNLATLGLAAWVASRVARVDSWAALAPLAVVAWLACIRRLDRRGAMALVTKRPVFIRPAIIALWGAAIALATPGSGLARTGDAATHPAEATRKPDGSRIAGGELLALRGNWSKGIPPCASCHGRRGLGVGTSFPPLAGREAAYIEAQLAAWKAGTRRGDPNGLMHNVAVRLDPAEAAAVAAYYASLPSPPRQEAPR